MLQLLGPWFFPITLRPSLQYEEHLQDLFCINNVLETLSPQLIICFKATKKSVKNLCSVLHRLKSLYLLPIHTPPLLRMWGCLEYLRLQTLPTWSGLQTREPLSNHEQCCECPTRSHLSRSHWPGCLQPCTEQLCNRKHPTHVPAT